MTKLKKLKSKASKSVAYKKEAKLKNQTEWYEFMTRCQNHDKKQAKLDDFNPACETFDPVSHMATHTIECQLLHYAVPIYYNGKSTMIFYNARKN
jgi:hypothetical protein